MIRTIMDHIASSSRISSSPPTQFILLSYIRYMFVKRVLSVFTCLLNVMKICLHI
jgi:hypothetical protein